MHLPQYPVIDEERGLVSQSVWPCSIIPLPTQSIIPEGLLKIDRLLHNHHDIDPDILVFSVCVYHDI